jgi:hypothetical protein
MALYRNVAGAEALGLARDYFTRDDGGGGGGSIDLVPIRSIDPVEQPVPTDIVFYDPWYVPDVPPTIAPDPVVIQPPPNHVYESPTGATIQQPTTQTVYPSPTGEVVQPVYPPTQLEQPIPTVAPTPIPTTQQVLKLNAWPLLTLAGVLLVSVKGEDLLHNKRHVVFLGGLAALYYLMNKPPTAVTT